MYMLWSWAQALIDPWWQCLATCLEETKCTLVIKFAGAMILPPILCNVAFGWAMDISVKEACSGGMVMGLMSLPEELLAKVANCLSLTDRARLEAVCKTLQSACLKNVEAVNLDIMSKRDVSGLSSWFSKLSKASASSLRTLKTERGAPSCESLKGVILSSCCMLAAAKLPLCVGHANQDSPSSVTLIVAKNDLSTQDHSVLTCGRFVHSSAQRARILGSFCFAVMSYLLNFVESQK